VKSVASFLRDELQDFFFALRGILVTERNQGAAKRLLKQQIAYKTPAAKIGQTKKAFCLSGYWACLHQHQRQW